MKEGITKLGRIIVILFLIVSMAGVNSAKAQQYFKISGYVFANVGTPVEGVEIKGLPGYNTVTNANGYYETYVMEHESYLGTPVKAGYEFSPKEWRYSDVTSDQAKNFWDTKLYTISGYVKDEAGKGLKNIKLNGLPATTVTDANGFYRCQVGSGWSGTVTPEVELRTFEPTKRTYANVLADEPNRYYKAKYAEYSISGYVRTKEGKGVPGVVVKGVLSERSTDWRGFYKVAVGADWAGSLAPQKTGYIFIPPSKSYDMGIILDTLTDENFTARPATDTDCSKVTVQSVQSGNWNDPTVWSPAGVPRQTDRVKINEWDTVTVTATGTISLTSLCNYGKLTIATPADLQITASDFLYNSGSIIGANGVSAAQAGSNVMLAAIKMVYNIGTIQGGNGANDGNVNAQGGTGGSVGVYAEKIFNEGNMFGGNGGYGHSCCPGGSGYGGDGGDVVVLATSILMNRANAVVSTGQGGSGSAVPYRSCHRHFFGLIKHCSSWGGDFGAGVSGDLAYSASTWNLGGILRGRTVTLEPSTFEMTESTARIEAEEDIIISGGQGTTVYLADLVDGAISAGGKISIRLGPGSTLDMRGLSTNAIKAGTVVEIFADEILTDEGITVENLIDAPQGVVTKPGKMFYEVVLTGTKQAVGEAGTQVKIDFTVINHSSLADTYRITVSDSKGWERSPVSSVVSLPSLEKKDLSFTVTLPSEAGAEETVTITAASESHPEATATLEVRVAVELLLTDEDTTDADKDGLMKFQEAKLQTNPDKTDTDEDGMDDGWEVHYKLNPLVNDASDDKDEDGYSNFQEYQAGSDPNVADSDKDGIEDGKDNCPGASNADQLDDDGNGVGNACQMSNTDNDNDGMPDEWETEYGLNPSSNDAEQDKDGDKWSNLSEFQKMTDPNDAADYPKTPSDIDRDGDKVADTEDVFPDDPTEWLDSDGDGVGDNADLDDDNDQMSDLYEVQYNLNPFNDADAMEDPDNDGYVNLQEFGAGTDPHNPASKPGTNPVNPNPDNSITISGSGGYKMFVTPISANEPGPMRVTQETDGSFKGTNGSTNVVVISDPTAIGESYTFTTGKNLTGTGAASELIVKPNSDGTNTYKVPESPEVAVTVKADGSYTARDEENSGAVFSGKSDGSFTVTDEESPGSIFAVDADGKKTVTDAEFTGMQAVINNDGTNTVTDTESPGMQAVANKNGTLTVTDAEFPGTVVVYNPADDSYSVTDPEFEGLTVVVKADGSYTITDADGKCYDITHKRGLFSFVKKVFNKVAKVVNKVAGFVKKAASFVKKVANFVAKAANLVKTIAPIVSKVFRGIAAAALFVGSIFPPLCPAACAIAGFATTVATVSDTVGSYAEKVEKKANEIVDQSGKVETSATNLEGDSKELMDATQKRSIRSLRDETPPALPDCEAVTLYTASGIINDSKGNAIPNVTVQIDDVTTTTDNTGAWKIIGLESEAYTVSAAKEGYTFTTAQFTIADENVTVSISEKVENPVQDRDGDGVVDSEDAFPDDPNESADADKDGIGNNADTDDDNDGMPDVWEAKYGLNPLVNDAAEDKDGDKYSNLQEYEADTNPSDADSKPESPFKAGVFTVGTTGVVQFDWLYDGGMYKGELGIFSLKGMEDLTPGSAEFVAEAVRRVLSDSTEGHLVLSDPTEAAHFSGLLGGESSDWNKGEYTGVKSFEMEPGDFFATILVPNSTFTALAANPGTGDSHKRPLFSLVSSNPAYGMYLGQIADVNGKGMAYAYEDMNAATSDKDYNDLIVQISGAAIDEVPSLNDMTGSPKRSKARDNSGWFDWRSETELGRVIMEHLDAQVVSPETVWLSADVNFPADITVYAPDEESFGTKGGYIPGATFGTDIDGYRFVKLPSLENGDYRIVLLSPTGQTGLLTLRKHQGDEVLSETGETVTVEAHGTVKAEVSVSDSGNESGVEISTAEQGIRYDFNGDGVIDDKDIELVSKIWNTCKGNENYDPFFDLDNDGCITVKDIMAVAGSSN